MSLPKIQTALPKRRYVASDIEFTVLGEVETAGASQSGGAFRYLLAAVPMGGSAPLLMLSCEALAEGGFGMYAYTEYESRAVGAKDDWGDVDVFAADALMVADKLLKLGGQEAMRVL